MIGLALLLALGVTLIAFAGEALTDRAADAEPEPGIAWSDALIFLLCLAGILAHKARKESDDE